MENVSTLAETCIIRDLSGLEQPWKELFEAAGRPSPFLSWEWHQSWVEVFSGKLEAIILARVQRDGVVQGVLPLQRVRRRGLEQLEFLTQGSGADELDCLLHPAAPGEVGGLLAERAFSLPWNLCRLSTLPAHGSLAASLSLGFPPASGDTRLEAGEELPFLTLPASFELLLNQHSANFRGEIRRRRRNMERRGGPVRLECAEHPEEVRRRLEPLFDLHNRRRRQKHERGMFEEPAWREFHCRAALRLAELGMTRVYVLLVGDEAVAALYGFATGQRFFYFQSGLAPEWDHLSPGTVLMSRVIEDCIARGIRQFEFLRGNESYKSRWTTDSRRTLDLLVGRGAAGRGYVRLRTLWRNCKDAPPFSRPNLAASFGETPLRETVPTAVAAESGRKQKPRPTAPVPPTSGLLASMPDSPGTDPSPSTEPEPATDRHPSMARIRS